VKVEAEMVGGKLDGLKLPLEIPHEVWRAGMRAMIAGDEAEARRIVERWYELRPKGEGG
jgi:hypothetical protein